MNIEAVRTALASAAAAVNGLRGVGFLADAVNPPVFTAGEVELVYGRAFGADGGLTEMLVTGRLYVSRTSDRAGQALLDGYLQPAGATSVRAAIEADRTLGGLCRTLRVERVHGYGEYEVAGTNYFGAQYDIRVWG